MKTKLDWSKAKSNRHAAGTKPVTIRMDIEVIQWLQREPKKQKAFSTGRFGYRSAKNYRLRLLNA